MSNVGRKVILTGLKISKSPHWALGRLYDKILRTCKNMPETAAYRKYTEQTINSRLDVLKMETDIPTVENKINSGTMEELIVQAENELLLSRKIIAWKAWEPLSQQPPLNQWKWPL